MYGRRKLYLIGLLTFLVFTAITGGLRVSQLTQADINDWLSRLKDRATSLNSRIALPCASPERCPASD